MSEHILKLFCLALNHYDKPMLIYILRAVGMDTFVILPCLFFYVISVNK